MTIQDLSEDQRVKIEIVWADKTFSVDSKVAGKRSTDILLKPYLPIDEKQFLSCFSLGIQRI